MTQVRYLSGGSNYLAQSELSVHFGIGSETEADIEIYYADGSTDSLAGVSSGRYTITARECIADFAPSGNLNFLDVSAFLGLFSSQHPQADLTVDGSFNFLDISAFLSAYGSGCP